MRPHATLLCNKLPFHLITLVFSPFLALLLLPPSGRCETVWGRAQLPKALRERLREAGFRTGRSSIHTESACSDGTRKFLLRLRDDRVVETVGIPVDDENHSRLTVCVSSQVHHPSPPAHPHPSRPFFCLFPLFVVRFQMRASVVLATRFELVNAMCNTQEGRCRSRRRPT